jgi:hypothetical protein
MAMSFPRAPVRTSLPALSRPGALDLSAATRLIFYLAYYLLNVCLTAEVYSVMLTLPVFILCCLNISRIRNDYATAQDMIWLVVYMFFVVAPLQTLRSGYFDGENPVIGLYFENSEIVTAEVIVFLFLLVATITTAVVTKYYPAEDVDYELSARHLPLLASLSIFSFLTFVFFMNGFANALAARYSRDIPETVTPIATSALALQSISCLLGCISLKRMPRTPMAFWLAGLSLCALIIALLATAQNPYNSARFMLLMTYLPLVLVLCNGKIRVSTFYLVAMAGLLVFMPILNFTGKFGMSVGESLEQINVSEYILKVPYMDVFNMLVYEVRYVQSTGLFWGGKTLGALLFFVPRAIWTAKETLIAQDMGAELVDLKSAGTDNLSLFFGGEFYADWGLLGVICGAFVVALLLTIFGLRRTVRIGGLDVRSYIVMAAAPIIIRGPIGAVMPLLFMQMIFLAILTRWLCRRAGSPRQCGLARSTR